MDSKGSFLHRVVAGVFMTVLLVLGCMEPTKVDTLRWDHADEDGTAVALWGQLILSESLEN